MASASSVVRSGSVVFTADLGRPPGGLERRGREGLRRLLAIERLAQDPGTTQAFFPSLSNVALTGLVATWSAISSKKGPSCRPRDRAPV